MLPLVFIGKEEMLVWLSESNQDQYRSPEELLIEIEDALENGSISTEQLQELINNFS